MGIKNLKKFLRENFPDTIKHIHITDFIQEKIAVDISSFIYKYKAVSGDDGWLNFFPSLICAMKRFNIHAVFIFDGVPPPEKDKEREKRKEAKNKLEDTVMNISVELDIYKNTQQATPLLLETMEKIKKSNEKTAKVSRLLHAGKKKDYNYIDVDAIEEFIGKKEKQIVNITKDDIDDIKKMLSLFGVPFIQAPGEAEALGAYLVSKEKVKAILTEDTDVLAYGTKIFISDFNTSTGECDVIYLDEVLEALEYTFQEFRDFCIMCGTDYNDNIPGYASGKVFKFINKYRSIEEFIKAEDEKKKPLDYKVLNHVRSRELFETFGELKNGEQFNPTYWETIINFEALYSFLQSKRCRFSAANIEEYWKEPEFIFEDE